MTMTPAALTRITDANLLTAIAEAAAHERSTTVRLIALLAEFDTRRLYLGEGCSSLFTYCTQVLHLSEHAAYFRIEAARCGRKFPLVLELLVDGAITLTTVRLLAPHLTPENVHDVLGTARYKSKRDVECLVAALRPLPAVPSSVRKLPRPMSTGAPSRLPSVDDRGPGESVPSGGPDASLGGQEPKLETLTRECHAMPAQPSTTVTPLAPERYKIQLTVAAETHAKLRRAQDLLRHQIPNGDPAAILDRALTLLVADLEKTRLAATARPHRARPTARHSRHVPAAVKRQVWERDQGRCAFVGGNGRCTERGLLELHHVVPFAAGGPTVAENLELRCRAHNAYEAEQYFGPWLAREATAGYYTRSGPS